MIDFKKFEDDLTCLINKHSLENYANIPDFIMSRYMVSSLILMMDTSRRREKWYGRMLLAARKETVFPYDESEYDRDDSMRTLSV